MMVRALKRTDVIMSERLISLSGANSCTQKLLSADDFGRIQGPISVTTGDTGRKPRRVPGPVPGGRGTQVLVMPRSTVMGGLVIKV